MLNASFPKSINDRVHTYIAPQNVIQGNLDANQGFDHGGEYRLQSMYGDEIWLKLKRAGLTPNSFKTYSVLELCAGTGFLTYHLLSKCTPQHLTVNDISLSELNVAKNLIGKKYPNVPVKWVEGDMHTLEFDCKFDVIIGNSFLHHFHNVPEVLSRCRSLLNPNGVFISLHEPTPMSIVVEGGKLMAYPLAIVSPSLVNNIARNRYAGEPSATDLWLFDSKKLKKLVRSIGFKEVTTYPWHLWRAIMMNRNGLHLNHKKSCLTLEEELVFHKAVQKDALLNKILPQRFFGSLCLVCHK